MRNVRIVPATKADIPVILDLIREFAEYEKLAHTVSATSEKLCDALFGTAPAAEVILAYCDQECAGFAVFFPVYSTFLAQRGLYLEDLYVKRHLRGQGIGLALLKHVARTTLERNCGRLEWGVLDWNEPAIKFYKKMGAVPMNDWTKYRLAEPALSVLASS